MLQKIADLVFGRYVLAEDDTVVALNEVEHQIDERLERAKEKAWARLQREA